MLATYSTKSRSFLGGGSDGRVLVVVVSDGGVLRVAGVCGGTVYVERLENSLLVISTSP